MSQPGCDRGRWIGAIGGLLGLAFCAVEPASAVPLRGQALSEQGSPLHGAEVVLTPVPSLLTPAGVPRLERDAVETRAVTDPRGFFVVEAPGPGNWRLRLGAPGHRAVVCDLLPLLDALEVPPVTLAPSTSASPSGRNPEGDASALVAAASPPHVRCRAAEPAAAAGSSAPAGRPLEVRLLAPDGKPAAGVRAILEDGSLHGPSDTAGHLQLALPRDDAVEARFWNPDGAWAAVFLRPRGPGSRPAGDGDTRLIIRLRPATTIAGVVLDRATRRPLPRALAWPTADPGRATWTDAGGRFTLRVPFLAAPALQAAAAGYRSATIGSGSAGDSGLVVTLAPAASVAGLAVDEAGQPVPGAEVEVLPAEISLPAGKVSGWSRTDSSGRFRLDDLEPGERLTARVRAPGFAMLESPLPPLGPDPVTAVRLALRHGRTVLGRVVDASGRPVPGAEVRAQPSEPAPQPEALLRARGREMRSTTGRDGSFAFAAVASGRLNLSLRAAGSAPKRLRGVEVPRGRTPLDLGKIVLGAESVLRGTVVDDSGSPVAGARVTALPAAASPYPGDLAPDPPPVNLTGADGGFALGGLEGSAKILLRAEQDGFLPATQEVEPGVDPEPVLLALQPAATLRGTVADEEGKPVEGARMVLLTRRAGRGDRLRPLAVAASDGRGSFSFAAVPPGSYRLAVQAAGYRPWSQPLSVDPGSPAAPVEVQLERGAVLSGRIVAESGRAVEGAEVSLLGEPGAEAVAGLPAAIATSDAEGAFRLDGLAAGSRRIQVLHPDYLPERRQVRIDGDETTRDFTLRAGAEVAGLVTDEADQPVAGAMVSLAAEQDPVAIPPRWTDAAGRFRVRGLAPARYSVLVESAGYAPAELAHVDVGRGAAPDLRVRLSRGATLFGQVHGLPAEERARLQVWASGPALAQLPGSVDEEGRYRVQNLGAGTWRVSARAAGLGREVSAALEVAPGEREVFLDLEFAAGYSLAGVVTAGGAAVAGALVSAQGLAGESSGAMTDAQGRFRLGPLAAGGYRIVVLDRASGAQRSWSVDLGDDVAMAFELPPPAPGPAGGPGRQDGPDPN